MNKKYRKKIISACIFIGLVGAYLGNLNQIPAFIGNFVSANNPEEGIYGIWLGKYSYPISEGILEVNGTTEYFKNNTYNFVGEIGLKINSKDNLLSTLYYVDGTGNWKADSKSLTIQLEDMSSWPKTVVYNGNVVDMNISRSILGKEFPRIEELIPQGITEEYEIVDINDDKFILRTDDPKGNMFEITMMKQSKRFQR